MPFFGLLHARDARLEHDLVQRALEPAHEIRDQIPIRARAAGRPVISTTVTFVPSAA
jgi:hypothetical protein